MLYDEKKKINLFDLIILIVYIINKSKKYF